MRSEFTVVVFILIVGMTWLLLPLGDSTGEVHAPERASKVSANQSAGLQDIERDVAAYWRMEKLRNRQLSPAKGAAQTVNVDRLAPGLVLDITPHIGVQSRVVQMP